MKNLILSDGTNVAMEPPDSSNNHPAFRSMGEAQAYLNSLGPRPVVTPERLAAPSTPPAPPEEEDNIAFAATGLYPKLNAPSK